MYKLIMVPMFKKCQYIQTDVQSDHEANVFKKYIHTIINVQYFNDASILKSVFRIISTVQFCPHDANV